ncbi:MAG: hypothetical protein ABFS23_02655 [Pseudomonadota bacterium]
MQRHRGSGARRVLALATAGVLAATLVVLAGAYLYWYEARQELQALNQRMEQARSGQAAVIAQLEEARNVAMTENPGDPPRPRSSSRGMGGPGSFVRYPLPPAGPFGTPGTARTDPGRVPAQFAARLAEIRLNQADNLLKRAERRWAVFQDQDGALDSMLRAKQLLLEAGPAGTAAANLLETEIEALVDVKLPDNRKLADAVAHLARGSHNLFPARPVTQVMPAQRTALTRVRYYLDSARVAALGGDAPLYDRSLAAALELLEKNFPRKGVTQLFEAELRGLMEIDLEPEPEGLGKTRDLLNRQLAVR